MVTKKTVDEDIQSAFKNQIVVGTEVQLPEQSSGTKRKFLYATGMQKPNVYNIHTKRFAFYQAGKCLVETLLVNHPKLSLLKITESKNNVVSSIQGLSPIETRASLKTLLIGLYAGKAGELFTGYPKVEIYQRLSSLKDKDKVVALRPRKNLVRVNGLFVNESTLRAKINFQIKTKLSQITYTCGIFCFAQTEDRFVTKPCFSKKRNYSFISSNFIKSKVEVEVKDIQTNNNVLEFRTKFLYPSRRNFQNDVVEGCTRSKSLLPLEYTLLREQNDAVLMSFHYSVLANQLNCGKIEQFLCQSSTGLFERVKATFLIQSIIVNYSIYAQNLFNLQKNSIVGNLNKTEIKDQKVFDLFQNLEEQTKNVYLQNNKSNRLFLKQELVPQTNNLLFSKKANCLSQQKEISALCEEIVCKSLTFSIKPYGHWFRIYLPQIETHQRQSVSSDQFFKKRRELGSLEYTKLTYNKAVAKKKLNNLGLNLARLPKLFIPKQEDFTKNLKNIVVPNKASASIASASLSCAPSRISFFKVSKDLLPLQEQSSYLQNKTSLVDIQNGHNNVCTNAWPQELGYGMCDNLVLNTFSQAFNLIGKNRELLDTLADHLIRFEKIRAHEISRIFLLYVETQNAFTTSID